LIDLIGLFFVIFGALKALSLMMLMNILNMNMKEQEQEQEKDKRVRNNKEMFFLKNEFWRTNKLPSLNYF
jgi:hypothetical protein